MSYKPLDISKAHTERIINLILYIIGWFLLSSTKLSPWKYLCYHCMAFHALTSHFSFSIFQLIISLYCTNLHSICIQRMWYGCSLCKFATLIIGFIVISKIMIPINACSNFDYVLHCLHWAFRHNLWWDKSITIPKPYLHHVRCILHSIKFRVYHSCETDIFVQWSSNQSMLLSYFYFY